MIKSKYIDRATKILQEGKQYFQIVRQNRWATFCFFISCLTPGLLIFFLFVIIPIFCNSGLELDNEKFLQNPTLTSHESENSEDELRLSHKINALEIEKRFLQSQLEMAKSDTFSLSLDLVDSVLNLYIKGVVIRQCKIHEFRISKAFHYFGRKNILRSYFSTPFVMEGDLATIPQIPIRVIHAPQDTTEAYERASKDIRLEKTDIYFTMHFNKNLVIQIEQMERPTLKGSIKRKFYNFRRRCYSTIQFFKAFVLFKSPPHRMWINLKISQADSKAIYRFVRENMRLTLRVT